MGWSQNLVHGLSVSANYNGSLTVSEGGQQVNVHILAIEIYSCDVVRDESNYPGANFSSVPKGGNLTFYGLWEYPFNGSIANEDIEFNIEGLIVTNRGWGVYADEPAIGTFRFFSESSPASFEFGTTDGVRHYIIQKPNHKALLSSYTELSNTISTPPDSGYGPIFWSDDMEWDFHGDVTSGMFVDRPYGTGNMSFGNFETIQMFSLTPRSIDPETLLQPALNLPMPEAYHCFLEKLSVFPKMGVKGYKINRGEEDAMPESQQNIQSILFNDICYKEMAGYWGEGHFFTFARTAFDWTRSQVAIRNGDSQATFEGLEYSLASGIMSGLVGFSAWGSDIGGYLCEKDLNRPTEELWASWIQFGGFSPIDAYQAHSFHQELYVPGPQTSIPAMRALFLEYPDDAFAYTASELYAFGEEFLIVPFIAEGGTREVTFPSGYNFLNYYTKTEVYEGGAADSISLDLEYSPEPCLEVEALPSFEVWPTTFPYYRKDGAIANITVTTDKGTTTAAVEVGDLAIKASVLVYHKKGVATIPLSGAGKAVVELVETFESLFD
ncbi:Alpha-xylosidase [Zalerion maritima]|uniref:Alpha-xylosidase n=1 Tax=Zalerion maritima TaxID=339359 RepID=A0AAD5RM78_9PEZI|nr:Alpha-xylosidase [Zalerion maritima]